MKAPKSLRGKTELTITEVMEATGIKTRVTIHRWILKGLRSKMRAYRGTQKQIFIKAVDLISFLQKHNEQLAEEIISELKEV